MLLSIDRVMQLLSEGKSVEKIAELSDVREKDVCDVISKARKLLQDQEGSRSKKKIIIRKKGSEVKDTAVSDFEVSSDKEVTGDDETKEVFEGAELSAVPLGSYLLMYTDGASSGNPGDAGIGILINDKENRTVGKVSCYVGVNTNNFAEYTALIRALEIAIYFKTKDLKIRTDSELVVKQIKGEYKVSSDKISPLYEKVIRLKKKVNSFRIEHIPRAQNDKADYLAKKGASNKRVF